MQGVRLPSLTLALAASDRVPRFSRLESANADSVWFVRFNMAKPSHPPWKGRELEVRQQPIVLFSLAVASRG